LIWS